MDTFIGIDSSGKRTAIAHVSANGKLLDCHYFETNPNDIRSYSQRYNTIYDYLLVRELVKPITSIYVEDAYMGVSRRGSVNHAKVVGSVIAACTFSFGGKDLVPELIMPATWRSKCGIKGRGKEPVWSWATQNYPANKIKNQDLADAACIAWAARTIHMENKNQEVQTLREKGII